MASEHPAAKFGESDAGPGEASPIRQPDSPIQPSAAQDREQAFVASGGVEPSVSAAHAPEATSAATPSLPERVLVEFVEWLLTTADDPALRAEITLNEIEGEATQALRRYEDAKEAARRV